MYDIIIIGSGPAGLSAAVYAQRAKLQTAVIEKEFMGTGQIAESSEEKFSGRGISYCAVCDGAFSRKNPLQL